MKTKHALLATGAFFVAALFSSTAGAAEPQYPQLPGGDPLVRHLPFTGSHVFIITDPGTPTEYGGFQNAQATSELTISVSLLDITELVLPAAFVASQKVDVDGRVTLQAIGEHAVDGQPASHVVFAGFGQRVSDTLIKQTTRIGGGLWRGELAGAGLLATEQLEVTIDTSGAVVGAVSVIEGVLIVPGYVDFAPFEGMTDLPPLLPSLTIPDGMDCRAYVYTITKDSQQGPIENMRITYTAHCEDLEIRDEKLVANGSGAWGTEIAEAVAIYRHLPLQVTDLSAAFGARSEYSVFGYVTGTEIPMGYNHAYGTFWEGPFAGTFLMGDWMVTPGEGLDGLQRFAFLVPNASDGSAPDGMINISTRGP